MSNDAIEKLLFLLAGWLLSTLTSALKDFQVKQRERRKIFSRLWMALEHRFIHLEIAPIAREAGMIDTVSGLLDIDESWRRRIPPAPPSLPADFDDILERVAEWESERGENWITKQLVSERGLSVYNGFLSDLKKSTNIILKTVSNLRLSNFQRVKRKLKGAFRRKPSSKNAMQPTAK
jgi:hypothetical protein